MFCLLNISLSYFSTAQALPTAIIDLYRCFTWAYTHSYAYILVTDYQKLDNYTLSTKQWLQQQEYYAPFIHALSEALILRSPHDYAPIIHRVLHSKITRCIVYYSGHHSPGAFVLPQGTLNDGIFLKEISGAVAEVAEIFLFMDCCYAPHFDLPYILQDNKFSLRNEFPLKFYTQRILVLAACGSSERVISKEEGSLISGGWWQLQKSMTWSNSSAQAYALWKQYGCVPTASNRNLEQIRRRMVGVVNDRQHVQFYASYVMDPVLWLWIGRSYPFTDVVTDLSGSILISRNDCQNLF